MAKTPLIYDGDMGGDDLWAISLLLAHTDRFDILGFATCFGNVSQPYATRNLLNFIHWINHGHIYEVAQGADTPCDGMRPFGDDAYGEGGIGGVILPSSPQKPWQGDIADWYAEIILSADVPVTIFCTGPATNIAFFIQKHPDLCEKIAKIVLMSGAIDPRGVNGMPIYDENGAQRTGNITFHAEFNAFQDPKALNVILRSGIKTVFIPADATQFLIYTQDKQSRIRGLDDGAYGESFHHMLIAVEPLDRAKYHVDGCFIHDASAAAYLIAPELFTGQTLRGLEFNESPPLPMEDTRRGQALIGASDSQALWLCGMKDPEGVFNCIENGLRTVISRARENQEPLEG